MASMPGSACAIIAEIFETPFLREGPVPLAFCIGQSPCWFSTHLKLALTVPAHNCTAMRGPVPDSHDEKMAGNESLFFQPTHDPLSQTWRNGGAIEVIQDWIPRKSVHPGSMLNIKSSETNVGSMEYNSLPSNARKNWRYSLMRITPRQVSSKTCLTKLPNMAWLP